VAWRRELKKREIQSSNLKKIGLIVEKREQILTLRTHNRFHVSQQLKNY